MAEELTLVPNFTPVVKAVQDLRAWQYKAVRFDNGGVRPATTTIDSGPAFVLANKPNSGHACELVSRTNHTKASAGGTITAGAIITYTTSQVFVATSGTFAGDSNAILVMGNAVTGCASGSIFTLAVK